MPLTAERIAELPAPVQPAWRDYLARSVALAGRRPESLADEIKAHDIKAPGPITARRTYGANGNESGDPAVLLKLMFLLFHENVGSERELMRRLPERLDRLWFLGYTLDDDMPNHSVLSKARARWGGEVFEELFVRTVQQCVGAGLVDGTKVHVDGSLIDTDASRDSVVKADAETIARIRAACGAQERKLAETKPPSARCETNRKLVSTTDPDAPCVSKGPQSCTARPRYKHHRMSDNQCGVITAVATTTGDVAEAHQVQPLVAQHEHNTNASKDVRLLTRIGPRSRTSVTRFLLRLLTLRARGRSFRGVERAVFLREI